MGMFQACIIYGNIHPCSSLYDPKRALYSDLFKAELKEPNTLYLMEVNSQPQAGFSATNPVK